LDVEEHASPSRVYVLFLLLANLLPMVLMIGGVYAAIFGYRSGAFVAVAGVFTRIAADVAIGVLSYREVMSRPWPQVTPFENDDEW
jgi:hypothetical protein